MADYSSTGFWGWYNRQCAKPFVGILMIPLSILVCFSPMIIVALIVKFFIHG